ncbi:jouberin isoform X2 [Procambarus clarkii]|nr:jouberin-like [Procambarus clarkii]XP_045615344.1 jouberin-like [Procambarus clarkii]XP_045615345.1 jouberin-like [Procambarus clarkii]XP_045615346.1 jouberin-like [Procambarus clarkii]XP_045615347.1 jouberin-like [Procambarus clarkii]XP_045615348.1 jouberin-like [Procambarus clarkii]
MAVEDLEPLTKTHHEDGGEREQEKNSGDALNAILTTALHKHAARKLGKKLSKKKKDAANTENDTNQLQDVKEFNKRTSKQDTVKVAQDDVELQAVTKIKSYKNKNKKHEGQDDDQAENVEEYLKKRREKDLAEQIQDLTSKENEVIKKNESGPDEENLCVPSISTSTTEYLKAVSVPKKKHIKKSKRPTKDSDKVLGVTIHCADRFEGSPMLLPHPVVQVHISNLDTGHWLLKSSKDRKATSYYEGNEVDYIMPIMTQPYDIKKERSLCCKWEEQLIINEPSNHFTSLDPQVLILFQLMDFPTPSRNNSSIPSNNCGWITFAWAFLKIKGANNHINIGHQLRLQLWRPRKSSNVNLQDLHSWWKSGNRNKYPSTLYVTLQEVSIPQNPHPALRSMLATQQEQGGGAALMDLLDQCSANGSNQNPSSDQSKPVVNWGRKPNQSCRILNSVKHCLSHSEKGCLVVKFSNDGLKLACGTHKQILIYDVLGGYLKHTLTGHLGLIYDISWSDNDHLLLTASADSTARVWHVDATNEHEQCQILAHPSYVYVARFVPAKSHVIVSGCYDHVLRIWSCNNNGSYSITQELSNHLGFVNALCFNPEGNILFSGDKQGVILVWKVDVSKKGKGKKKPKVLILEREVKISDIAGNIINYISFHPGGFRLLVHTRDSQIRLLNHKHWTITHRLRGLLNVREQMRSCISPCGTLIFSGSEDHGLYVWNSDTGDMISALMDLPIEGTISCVDYHPNDHMMAVCSYSSEAPVLILGYNPAPKPANTAVRRSVQPAASRSLQTSAVRSPSPNQLPLKQPLSLSLTDPSYTMFKSESSPSKSKLKYWEERDSEIQSFTYSQSVVDKRHTIFNLSSQYLMDTDQMLNGRRHWDHHGDKILKKLDSVLKMASEDPLNMRDDKIIDEVLPLGQLATVLYDYHSTKPDELSVKQGDYVIVVQETNGDWWLVRTADMRTVGLVPASYLQQLPGGFRQEQEDETDLGKVIAVPSGSGEVSFITDVDGTPSKARARRHKAKAQSPKIFTSTPKGKENT